MSRRAAIPVVVMLLCVVGLRDGIAQNAPVYDVVYRPGSTSWLTAGDEQFTVIYRAGDEQEAREAFSVLKRTRSGTDAFVGVDRPYSLTAIVSGISDTGNGFVTPFPFKTELSAVPLRGRRLSRRHRSWIEVVSAHELVHAAQAEFRVQYSPVDVIGRFAPDVARGMSLAQPPGLTEGLAVYRESTLSEGAGRLNHPYFMMLARAGMEEPDGWTLSQALERPSFTKPFDRFYHGGSLFVMFMMETYGREALEALLRWHQWVPVSGSGLNLRLSQGRWPRDIEASFRRWNSIREDSIREAIGPLSASSIVSSRQGQSHRRPFWLSTSEVVAYVSGYNLSAGFQRVEETGRMSRISRNEVTDDVGVHLAPSTQSLLYSRYEEHPLAPEVRTSWSYIIDLASGEERRLSGSRHTYNPVQMPGGSVLALRSDGQYNRIVAIGSGTESDRLAIPGVEFVSLMPRPGSDSLIVLAKKGPNQTLYSVDTAEEAWTLSPWIGSDTQTIYDGSWDTSGRYFSFTSDRTGVLNVYVMDAWTEDIHQATSVLYGAMEGHVSPDGRKLIFVSYRQEQFDLQVMSLEECWAKDPLDRSLFHSQDVGERAQAAVEGIGEDDSSADGPTFETAFDVTIDSVFDRVAPYQPWRHLSPRVMYPVVRSDQNLPEGEGARLGLGWGIAAHGVDPLQRMAWFGNGFLQKGRMWGRVGVQSGRFPFRPSVVVSREPTLVDALVEGEAGVRRIIRDRQSWSASAVLPYTLWQNVSRSSLLVSMVVSYRIDRFLDEDMSVLLTRKGRLAIQPSVFMGRRVVRNPRDIWPTEGQYLSWFADLEGAGRTSGYRASIVQAGAYVPVMASTNTSIRLDVGHLFQNKAGVIGTSFFKPVGWRDALVEDRGYVRAGLKVRQPILFPDKGWLTVPVFFRAVYLRTGLETMQQLAEKRNSYSSVSVGVGLKVRFWHAVEVDLAWEAGYRLETGDWATGWVAVSDN